MMLENLRDDTEPPNTYYREMKPLDTILCTRGVVVKKAGYLPFGEGVVDHRDSYVDISIAPILGVNLLPKKAKAHRHKLQCPSLIKKYNKCLNHLFKYHSLSDQTILLQVRVSCPITSK